MALAAVKRAIAIVIPERLERPLRSSAFRRLALGKSISFLGDWVMVAVLVGWVYQSTSSVAQVALLMAIRLVPPIVGGGLAASLVDRLPRLKVLVWSEIACAATVAGALVGVTVGSRVLVFALVGLCGLAGMVSTVAGNALIPLTVEQDELPAANAIHSVGQEVAMALGAVTGGVTLAVGGPAAGLAANLASYGLAVLLYARIRVASEPQKNASRTRGGLAEGFRYVVSQRPLAAVVGGFAVGSTIWRTTMLGAVALAPAVDAIASPAQAITVAAGFLLVGAVFVHIALRPLPQAAPAAA